MHGQPSLPAVKSEGNMDDLLNMFLRVSCGLCRDVESVESVEQGAHPNDPNDFMWLVVADIPSPLLQRMLVVLVDLTLINCEV
jgi:hypothetical protein